MIGVKTIGNATMLCYDNEVPILTTDPWFGHKDPAYFGSWVCSHEIPESTEREILNSKYIWFSHGHPDHLNPQSIKNFKKNKILISNHYGERIHQDLLKEKYDVTILPDRKWVELSKNIAILSVITPNQDSILLIKINDTLFVNLNDAETINCTKYIRKISKNFHRSFLLALGSYGDADMINFYDEKRNFIVPPAANNSYVGEHLSFVAKSLSLKGVIPFSSFHQYQRSDSIWAQKYTTPIHEYRKGFDESLEFVEPFSFIDCSSKKIEKLLVKPLKVTIKKPEDFGDNYSDILDVNDVKKIKFYFKKREKLLTNLGYIIFRVGGVDRIIDLNKGVNKGVTFELPRSSLMQAIEWEIFDDLLIGNFMKTTLHNMSSLYEGNFNQKLTKFSDNGRVFDEENLFKYMKFYNQKSGREYIYNMFLDKSKSVFQRLLSAQDKESKFYRTIKSFYYRLK